MEPVHETTELDATPDEVWQVLTDPDGTEAWLGSGAVLDPVDGGSIHAPDPESGVPRTGSVDHADPGRRLDYTWWPTDPASDLPASTVTIELIPTGAGTRLVVTERPLDAQASIASATWRWRLAGIQVGIWCRTVGVTT
jgi:uncharacterized protein YndB with AHSA1/START domain